MTTSERPAAAGVPEAGQAYVWVWLPGATEPVVAGRVQADGARFIFTYGRTYLARAGAVPLYEPELPLRRGRIGPPKSLSVAGCINDAGPGAWGQRVILARRAARAAAARDAGGTAAFGRLVRNSGTAGLGLLTYLLESGSDRIGALDFQVSATEYVPRVNRATLAQMQTAAEELEAGHRLPADLEAALLHGTSIGGARPKVMLRDHTRQLIAKLSSRTDPFPVVKAEGVAMELAQRAGLQVAKTEVNECMGKDVLLVERFDRTPVAGERKMLVSALTILGLDEMFGRYATYPDLADVVRARFTDPAATLRELFARIVFNICIGNTDDHARNHAAFWDGRVLRLTPAYDLCPQLRSGTEAAQAMAIGRDGARASQFAVCVDSAHEYLLSRTDARAIIDQQVAVINDQWAEAADAARLTAAEAQQLWRRQILNDFIAWGY